MTASPANPALIEGASTPMVCIGGCDHRMCSDYRQAVADAEAVKPRPQTSEAAGSSDTAGPRRRTPTAAAGTITLVPSYSARMHAVAVDMAELGGDLQAAEKSRRTYVYECAFADDADGTAPEPIEMRSRSLRAALSALWRAADGQPFTVLRAYAKDHDDAELGDPGWQVVAAGNGADWRRPFA